MNKEELRNYAISILEPEIAKIEEAYKKGYEDGKNENTASAPKPINGVKFYDLGLPSGTLWSEPLKGTDGENLYIPYVDAASYDLPSRTQVEEIQNNCIRKDNALLGPNGKLYPFDNSDYYWIRNSDSEDPKSYSVIDLDNNRALRYTEVFKGSSHKVIITKIKD